MHDVTEQMAAYFDATVERVTAEDVLAGRSIHVQNGRHDPVHRRRLQPAWVLAAGFAVTIVLVGGAVVAVRWLSTGSTTEFGTDRAPVGDAGAGVSVPWVLIAVGALLVASVVALVIRPRSKIAEEKTMQTLDRPEVETSPRPRSPAIFVIAAGLLIAAAGLLGWWIGSSGEGGAVSDVPDIVTQFNQALADGDAEGVAALFHENGVLEEKDLDVTAWDRDEQLVGRGIIATYFELGAGAVDTEEIDVNQVMVLDNVIVYEWTARGTRRDLPTETTGVILFEMDGDLIARGYLLYDTAEWFNVGST